MKKAFLLLVTVFLVSGFGQELVKNGGFEDGLSFWVQEANNSAGTYTITRDTAYQPDSDYEVKIYKNLRYFARIVQTVELPGTNVQFSASAKLLATTANASSYNAHASVTLQYQDRGGASLGKTIIVKRVGNYNPVSDSFQHVINVTSNGWEDYDFLLADELENLPGVDPEQVAKVTISLNGHGNGIGG